MDFHNFFCGEQWHLHWDGRSFYISSQLDEIGNILMITSSFAWWCLVFYINYTLSGNKPTTPSKQELIDKDNIMQNIYKIFLKRFNFIYCGFQ